MWTKTSQRTVKCRTCGVRDFYVYTDGTRSELRDKNGQAHAGCIPVPEDEGNRDAQTCPKCNRVTEDMADHTTAAHPVAQTTTAPVGWSSELAALIPDESHARSYIARKLNGKTDVETLVLAYKVNKAHAEGVCLPECSQNKPKGYVCKRRPQNVLLSSDTGAGKNHLVRAVAATLRVPYLRIPLNGGVTVDGLLGRLDLRQENGASVTRWQDGRLTKIAREGGIICLDEVNACPQAISFILHPMLDDERTCIIDDHSEAFPINSGTFFVGTMNPDYAGTRTMNAALKSRFGLPIPLDYEDSIEKKLIADPRLLKLAKQLRQQFRLGDGSINTPVGTRTLLDFESNSQLYGRDIAVAAFVAAFETSEEQVAVKQALELHLRDATPIDVDADVNLDDPTP